MDDVFITIILLLIVFFWRGLTSGTNIVARCFQKCLHCCGCNCGPLAALFQWYSLLFVGLGLLLARTFYDVVKFEYIKYNFLLNADVVTTPNFLPGISAEEMTAMEMGTCLRIFSLAAPCAGFLAGIVVVMHVIKLVSDNARRLKERGVHECWALSSELNMVILVIAMPMVFILMAMRAEIRVWAVMTGSAWLPYHNGPQPPPVSWDEVKTVELATYTTDIELAGFFQYITIFSFGRLCVSYLRDAPPQYRFTLKFAALQGVYIYVIFGLIRAAGTFVEAVASHDARYQLVGAVIREKVLTFIGPIFTVATIQCVYNMMIICRMDDVKKKLGNANMKFQATRALVLISQVQQGILLGIVVGGPVYVQLQHPYMPEFIQNTVRDWSFSPYRAKLMHAALLNVECLIVVLMNRCFWNNTTDYSHAGAREVGLQRPLLDVDANEEAA